MNTERVTQLRMERQYLLSPAENRDTYDLLFRAMSPVHTMYWTEPGAPPLLMRRAAFDDLEYNQQRRARREILKGRFQNGSVGYVDYRDLELYACAYRKEIPSLGFEELALLNLITQEGPLTIGGIKEITGMRVKNISPVMHKLQQAFLLFEDQIDNDGDRAWYAFESEFPEIDIHKFTRPEAIRQIIRRALPLAVRAEAAGLQSFLGFNSRDIQEALAALTGEGAVQSETTDKRVYYFMREDAPALYAAENTAEPARGVFLLQRSDFWTKTEEYSLKKRFPCPGAYEPDHPKPIKPEVLYYIVIDGKIDGAVMGRFKFGPHVIEDIVLDERIDPAARRAEILRAVYDIFDEEQSPVKRYNGMVIS